MADGYLGSMFDVTGKGYAPEWSQGNINKLTQGYADLMRPTNERQMAGIGQLLGGGGTLYGTPGSNKLQLLAANQANQIGQYGQNLMQQGLGQTSQERLLGEERTYERPFREQAITGMWGGNPTMQYQNMMLPYVTQGLVGKSALGTNLQGINKGNVSTEREIDPAWWAAQRAGFTSPLEQSMYNIDPASFNRQYGYFTKLGEGQSYNPYVNYNSTQNPYQSTGGVRAFDSGMQTFGPSSLVNRGY